MQHTVGDILALLPGKDCGQCGFRTCRDFAEHLLAQPADIRRCVHLDADSVRHFRIPPVTMELRPQDITWRDLLDREYDVVLEPFPEDPGPREVILPFNPLNVERLDVAKGDILFGRPAQAACPITHVGRVMEAPDLLNALITWCVVGPLAAREAESKEIGNYTPVAYMGLVRHARVELQVGRRYHFLPGLCMLQSRHSGVITELARRPEATRVRFEGIWIS
ncbi:hypothetical protein B1C78_07000 [Thioalkalivibrio denitrificans]|uniref:4Fe-4S domain-containing protein n=1 Tax=Thioalkalivibrio denitrificans TaxID=108003 RepID=A0A1V3NJT3_9GAMM|nr:(Fe-S)-binding protein [Thioalkalivibrio denitrificans]OOG25158.1 hypothetical protein B1C78_07000 [Thioalkalivibrio denitrificans]